MYPRPDRARPAASAPELGAPRPRLPQDWAHPMPHLRRNWAQQLPHLSGTGLAPAGRARLPQWFEGPRARGDLMVFASGTVSGTARGREGLCTSDAQPWALHLGPCAFRREKWDCTRARRQATSHFARVARRPSSSLSPACLRWSCTRPARSRRGPPRYLPKYAVLPTG